MKTAKEILREKLVKNEESLQVLFALSRLYVKESIVLVEAETDMVKRKELIDYLYADEMEVVMEYHIRKNYLPKEMLE